MEDAIKNCNRQLTAIEHILPTLATKIDLERFATKADLDRYATKADLREGLDDAKRHTRVLFESLDDRIRAVADGYFALSDKMDGVTQRIDRLTERLEQKG